MGTDCSGLVSRVWGLSQVPDALAMERIGEPWRPYRAVAARLLWHHYLNDGYSIKP